MRILKKTIVSVIAAALATSAWADNPQNNAGDDDKVAYLFTYFTGNAPEEEQVCYALSDDGYNFTQGGKFALVGGSPNLGNRVTIQVVCGSVGGTGSWPHLFGSTNDFCNIYYNNNAKVLSFKTFNASGGGKKVDLDVF